MQLGNKPFEQRNPLDRLSFGEVVVGAKPDTPTRLTLSTPSEEARLSLGASKGAGLADIEPGITARTQHHANVTITAPDDVFCRLGLATTADVVTIMADVMHRILTNDPWASRTLQSLGLPSRLDPHSTAGDATGLWPEGFRSKIRSDTEYTWGGECVYTTGASLHYALGDCRIVSTQGNVLVRSRGDNDTNWAALYSDKGETHVYAKRDVWVGSGRSVHIGATSQVTLPQPGEPFSYSEGITDIQANQSWFSGFFSLANTVVGAGVTITSVIAAIHHALKWKMEAMPDFQSWNPTGSLATKIALSVLGVIAKGADLVAGIAGWTQNVNVYADKDVNIISGMAAGIYGNTSASLSSLINASVSGLNVGVSGAMFAGLSGGIGASLGALKDVDIEAQFGKTTVKGGLKGVEVSSAVGRAALAGQLDTEVKSVLGRASMVGGKSALVAAGIGTGWGIQIRPTGMTMGPIPSLNPFSGAFTIDLPCAFYLRPANAKLSYGPTEKLTMAAAGTSLQSTFLKLKGEAIVKLDAPVIMVA